MKIIGLIIILGSLIMTMHNANKGNVVLSWVGLYRLVLSVLYTFDQFVRV